MRNPYIYIAIMAGVSYLIRTLPLTLIRKEIKSPFIRSEATNNPIAGVLALIVGIILSWCGRSLFTVAVLSCLTVFIAELIL